MGSSSPRSTAQKYCSVSLLISDLINVIFREGTLEEGAVIIPEPKLGKRERERKKNVGEKYGRVSILVQVLVICDAMCFYKFTVSQSVKRNSSS